MFFSIINEESKINISIFWMFRFNPNQKVQYNKSYRNYELVYEEATEGLGQLPVSIMALEILEELVDVAAVERRIT